MKELPRPPRGGQSIPPTGNPKIKETEAHSAKDKTSKECSERKRQANQKNATKSTGPKNTSSTRLNALKHGLRASKGITELDDAQAHKTLAQNLLSQGPSAAKAKLAENIALDLIRLERGALMEAEYITSKLHPEVRHELFGTLPNFGESVIQEGFVATLDDEAVHRLTIHQRYRTSLINNVLKMMNQLERVQRIESGENISAPIAANISLTVQDSSPSPATLEMEIRGEEIVESFEGKQASSGPPNSDCLPPKEDELQPPETEDSTLDGVGLSDRGARLELPNEAKLDLPSPAP
jgi:hypothetical protein